MPTIDRLDARVRSSGMEPRSPRRRRPIAAIALVAVLTIAWLAFQGRHAPGSPAAPPTADALAPAPDTSSLRAALHAAPGECVDLIGDVPEVSCLVAGVQVDAKLVGPAELTKVYVAATGARLTSSTGAPACAAGHEEERSWSRPQAPTVPVGRYQCRDGAMWWTDDHGVLAHATAPGRDLAQLFAWWRVHLVG